MGEDGRDLERFVSVLKRHTPELEEEFKVKSLGVFGSYVRGEQKEDSDLDVLVEFYEMPGLIEFGRLERHLSNILGVKVDLVPKDSLKPRIGERILNEVVTL